MKSTFVIVYIFIYSCFIFQGICKKNKTVPKMTSQNLNELFQEYEDDVIIELIYEICSEVFMGNYAELKTFCYKILAKAIIYMYEESLGTIDSIIDSIKNNKTLQSALIYEICKQNLLGNYKDELEDFCIDITE